GPRPEGVRTARFRGTGGRIRPGGAPARPPSGGRQGPSGAAAAFGAEPGDLVQDERGADPDEPDVLGEPDALLGGAQAAGFPHSGDPQVEARQPGGERGERGARDR